MAVTEDIEPCADEDDVALGAAAWWPDVQVQRAGIGEGGLSGGFPAGIAGEFDRRLGGRKSEAVRMGGLSGSLPVQVVQKRGDVGELWVEREAFVGRDGGAEGIRAMRVVHHHVEIGRASCRERVERSVVGGA